jgi:outer membrane protein TolC
MRPSLWILVVAGCASAPPPPAPDTLPFAAALLERRTTPPPAPAAPPSAAVAAPPARGAADEIRGLVPAAGLDELRRVAEDDAALGRFLRRPATREQLAALAWLRSPDVRAARARVQAARTGFAQSRDLSELVALYRSFVRDTRTRVGPERSRRATESIAPAPNVDALRAEVVRRTVDIAFEELRATVRDTVAAAERAHADAVRLAAARRVVDANVKLHESLTAALEARFEAGGVSQAGLLAFEARLQKLRTELEILERERAVVRAVWNRLLSRAEDAPVALDLAPVADRPLARDAAAVLRQAREERQELRAAQRSAERAALAVRLAETMTLPRLDLGPSRLEHERAADVFPEPGRMVPPRADFGVKEAQVGEMRARLAAAERALDAWRDRVGAEVREALFALDAAARRRDIHSNQVVPLAQRSFEASRGAYEGNRTGYIELLDSARRLLEARLARIDAARAHAHARARLLQVVGVRPEE